MKHLVPPLVEHVPNRMVAFSLVEGGTAGAVLSDPRIGMVAFYFCLISLISVTAREATTVELTPSSRKIDVRCRRVSLSFLLLSSFV
jgi:hypothetical protein